MFIITKLFSYFYRQLVFVNFQAFFIILLWILSLKKEREVPYADWRETKGTADTKRADPGGAGGPHRALQGLHLPAGAGLNLPLHRHEMCIRDRCFRIEKTV